MYSNYNDQNVAATDSQSELTKLRLENQALQMLLKEYLKKNALLNDDDDTEASSTRRAVPPKYNITHPILMIQLKHKLSIKAK